MAAGAVYVSVTLQRLIASQNSNVMQTAFNVGAWPFGFCLCSAVISVIYRYLPNRVRTPSRWITWGSAFAFLFWLLGTWLFALYAANFGSFNRTYGVRGEQLVYLGLALYRTFADGGRNCL